MPPQYAQYPPPRQSNPLKVVLIVVGVVVGVLFLGGMLVGILAVATLPKLVAAKAELDQKNAHELLFALQDATVDNKKKRAFNSMQDKSGLDFWNECFKQDVIDRRLLSKVVSLGSAAGDLPAKPQEFDARGLQANNCSFTSPRGRDVPLVLNLRGSKRAVVLTFDSRNWNNFRDKGVLVVWSEGNPEWLTFENARSQYGITQAEWDDPVGQLFGKKAPFQYTHE
jgi:hypothetical protein